MIILLEGEHYISNRIFIKSNLIEGYLALGKYLSSLGFNSLYVSDIANEVPKIKKGTPTLFLQKNM